MYLALVSTKAPRRKERRLVRCRTVAAIHPDAGRPHQFAITKNERRAFPLPRRNARFLQQILPIAGRRPSHDDSRNRRAWSSGRRR